MDLYDAPTHQSPVIEFHAPSKKESSIEHFKQRVFLSMAQLEGWCSNQKASLLMDYIFLKKPEVVVEIGVFGGKSLIPMAYALQKNRSGKIYGIDPWSCAKSTEGWGGPNEDYWAKLDHDAILSGLQNKIIQFKLTDEIELIRASSEDAPIIENIQMLHIDGNHSEETSLFDVKKWVPLVEKGGLIIFDDVNWESTSKAVSWLNQNCVKWLDHSDEGSAWGIWIQPQ